MTWIKHKPVHDCPIPPASSASTGDRWRCDDCQRVWRRTGANSAHELTGNFSVWRLAVIATWRSRRAHRRVQGADQHYHPQGDIEPGSFPPQSHEARTAQPSDGTELLPPERPDPTRVVDERLPPVELPPELDRVYPCPECGAPEGALHAPGCLRHAHITALRSRAPNGWLPESEHNAQPPELDRATPTCVLCGDPADLTSKPFIISAGLPVVAGNPPLCRVHWNLLDHGSSTDAE